jgi:hypothetical protein
VVSSGVLLSGVVVTIELVAQVNFVDLAHGGSG